MKKDKIKQIVKEHYNKIASTDGSCCSSCCSQDEKERVSKSIGYSEQETAAFFDANLGLGCGNPTGIAKISEGDVVLDLGSGAGFDCFLAAKKVGVGGQVIGVDMTEAMVAKANANAEKYGYKNVRFIVGDIEKLPVKDNSVDVVISNCVVNLAPNKLKVFKEAYRVLRKGGKIYLSDIVLLENLSEAEKDNEELIAGCVGGALLKEDYLSTIKDAGFTVTVLSEDKDISKRQYKDAPLESIKIEATK